MNRPNKAKRKRTERQKIGVGVGIGIGVEKKTGMAFGHERLDAYRAAIAYVGWAYRFCEALTGHRNAKDQLLRASQASQAIP
jgi:hypothetical protein